MEQASGNLRYLAANKRLTLNLSLPDSAKRTPWFRGTPMRALGGRRYKGDVQVYAFDEFTITVYTEAGEALEFDPPFRRAFVDSLPDTLSLDRQVSFEVASQPLSENESLVVFFEPYDGDEPHRILVTGPTRSGTVSLPTSATEAILEGEYEVYLVRQGVYRTRQADLKLSLQTEYFTPSRGVMVR